MQLSVIVPAYNEAKLIEAGLNSMRTALAAMPEVSSELIVANNASDDNTAELARAAGARVVDVPERGIARARNGGAEVASGDWLLFIDADCWPSAELVTATWQAMQAGDLVGGGSTLVMPGLSGSQRALVNGWNRLSRWFSLAAGSYLFCRADAFRAVGGFDNSMYVSEELDLTKKLKDWGRQRHLGFRILHRHPLSTSARKFSLYSVGERWQLVWAALRHPLNFMRDRSNCNMWYDGRR